MSYVSLRDKAIRRFQSVSLVALFVAVFVFPQHVYADTSPPGLNTPHSVNTLSIAVQDGVGITLSNSGVGATPTVTIPGDATAHTLTISDHGEAVGHICQNPGMLAETSNYILLSCQPSGTGYAWQPAQSTGASCGPSPSSSGEHSTVVHAAASGFEGELASAHTYTGNGAPVEAMSGYDTLYQCQNGTWVAVYSGN